MSRPRPRVRLLLLAVILPALLGAVLATGVEAQEAAAWRDSALRTLPRLRALQERLGQRDSGLVVAKRVGAYTIRATAAESAAAAVALPGVVEEFTRRMGRLDAPARIQLRSGADGSERPQAIVELLTAPGAEGMIPTMQIVRRTVMADSTRLGRTLLGDLAGVWFSRLDRWLGLWLQRGPPVYLPEQARRADVLYRVATSTLERERACVAGDDSACLEALGLVPGTSWSYPQPVRGDFFLLVLAAGGDGAVTRLLDRPERPVAERVADAAGRPLAPMATEWRAGLLALRPPTRLSITQAGVGLGWMVVALLLALRDRRWT